MLSGRKIEEKPINLTNVPSSSEDSVKVKNLSILHSNKETEQAQAVVAKSRKTYEGTNIKVRNPIIVTMLIMQLVMDALKDSSDKTKEITKLQKRMWKYYSDGQSNNFKQGESCQSVKTGTAIVKMVMGVTANGCGENGFLGMKYLSKSNLNLSSDIIGGLGDSYFQQKQMDIQTEEAKFNFKTGHTSNDYQNQSQQLSSDNQVLDGAREKSIQLGRLMAQLITAQPA